MKDYTPFGRDVLVSKGVTLTEAHWRSDLDTVKALNEAVVPENCTNVKQSVSQSDLLGCVALLEKLGHKAVNIVTHPDRVKKDGIKDFQGIKVWETVVCPPFVLFVLSSPEKVGKFDKKTSRPLVTDRSAIARILVL